MLINLVFPQLLILLLVFLILFLLLCHPFLFRLMIIGIMVSPLRFVLHLKINLALYLVLEVLLMLCQINRDNHLIINSLGAVVLMR